MVLGHRRHSSARSSGTESVDDYEDEVIDSEQGNILMHIISQLRPGADLSRVTLPTFILEPRSMLERITNFMAHPEMMLPIPDIDDPTKRFLAVVKFYLSGWHIKPPGVKKPLNPILGETFTGYWDYPDNTKGYYISEQTSHHPPKSSYFYMCPEHHIRIDGTLKPRSKFLGNSAASMMEGIAIMRFTNRNERYFVTQPNIYSRGILFGKMKYELGDHSFVRCPELGLMADLEFKTKGYFSGTYNAIGGVIKNYKTDEILYELSGLWNESMFAKDVLTGQKELIFNARTATPTYPSSRPLEEQDERESQKLWFKTTQALIRRDQETATAEKSHIEEEQRAESSRRADEGIDWRPRLFRPVQGGPRGSEEGEEDLDWILKAKIDAKTPDEITKQILQVAAILPGQKPDERFSIPSRKSTSTIPTSEENAPITNPETPVSTSKTTSTTTPDVQSIPTPNFQTIPPTPANATYKNKVISGADIDPTGEESKDLVPDMAGLDIMGKSGRTLSSSSNDRDCLKRLDSQTSEMDEFHDAQA